MTTLPWALHVGAILLSGLFGGIAFGQLIFLITRRKLR